MLELLWLLIGTIIYRPYVYAFFACFLYFALQHLRARGTFLFLCLAYAIAFICEYSSTRNGFPFGFYTYFDDTRNRELWLSNIPFWDSLSFVFLSYFSWITAALARSPEKPAHSLVETRTAVLGGFLMMLLDVVIDPLALRGDQWFLGRIYEYPGGGPYFGVPLSNFLGWWFVGTTTLLAAQKLNRMGWLAFREVSSRTWGLGCFGIYASVFAFNLSITAWIGEGRLLAASTWVTIVTLTFCAIPLIKQFRRRFDGRHSEPVILLCAATAFEARACQAGVRLSGARGHFEILKTGIGEERAKKALLNRIEHQTLPRPTHIISAGFAGSLVHELQPMTWIVGHLVDESDRGTPSCAGKKAFATLNLKWAQALVHSVTAVTHVGDVHRPSFKKGLHAIDMESSVLAQVAREKLITFEVMRMISDSPSRPIPDAIRYFGNGHFRAGFIGALKRPAELANFLHYGWTLTRRLKKDWSLLAPALADPKFLEVARRQDRA